MPANYGRSGVNASATGLTKRAARPSRSGAGPAMPAQAANAATPATPATASAPAVPSTGSKARTTPNANSNTNVMRRGYRKSGI